MKNLRKIVAIMAAVLMMISVLPMSAFAAPGDVIIDKNFDDGSVFSNASAENGYMVFDATIDDWYNVYMYANAIKSGTKYEITFDAKANKATNINVKINNNWAGDTFKWTTDVTTEWATYSCVITPDELAPLTSTPLLMFTSNAFAADGAIYHIDNVVVKEYAESIAPGSNLFVNGDFETGNTNGWNKHQQTTVTADAAKDGSYGAYLNGNSASWGGVLDQNVNVEDGKTYVFSFDYMAIRQGFNYALTGVQSGTSYNSGYISTASWTHVEKEITIAGDTQLKLNFNCGGQSGTDEMYVDNISLVEVIAPDFDGYIYNGGFETGEANPWTLYSGSNVSADAAYTGNFGLICTNPNGDWGGTAYQDFTTEVGKTYVVKMDAKAVAGGQNIQIQNGGATKDSKWFTTTSWTSLTFEFTATDASSRINICGGNTGSREEIYVDNVLVFEKKDAATDGFIVNGDFEIGVATPWTLYSGSNVSTNAAYTGNFGLICTNPNGGWGGTAYQDFSVEIGKSYEVTMWAKAISKGQNIQIQNGGATKASKWFTATEWTLLTFEFTATDANVRINICGGGTGAEEIVYFDDIQVKELKQASNDGFIINGDFETGEAFPWDNLWGSCPTVEITEGMDGGYGLHIISGSEWRHVRQINIAVEPNTWYEVNAWAKNSTNMYLLVKGQSAVIEGGANDALETGDINKVALAADDEWTQVTNLFNSGDHNYILVSLMAGANDAGVQEGTFDNISMKKHEHEYDGCEDVDCDVCGETREATAHNLTYVEAVIPANCLETGHDEYWKCENCDAYFGDAEGSWQVNPAWMMYTGDCVRPEGAADCAIVPCSVCGEDNYGYGEHDVLACQGGTCSKCGDEIEGYGCANYDTPACEDGVCYYCGGPVAGYGHENGAWAPCCDGECSYGCGLQYPATEDHVDEDGDEFCDNCWTHLAHVDEDGNGECDICYQMMPVPEIVYGDANGDGAVNINDVILLQKFIAKWDVTLDEASADANADGSVNINDVILLQKYIAKWDVTLGK